MDEISLLKIFLIVGICGGNVGYKGFIGTGEFFYWKNVLGWGFFIGKMYREAGSTKRLWEEFINI